MKIKFHQLLYGYQEGHRLLAGSTKPEGKSAKTLLSLSDLSGQGMTPGPNGYLTGFPLPLMGAYALSRTWLANEIPRPGCVWTQTLLIDFSDLAFFVGFDILCLFQRPSPTEGFSSYSRSLEILSEISARNVFQIPQILIQQLIEAIYEFPKDCIFLAAQNDSFHEEMVLGLWSQQWPRLRRNFRFCTWTSIDRSQLDEPFDLQFITNKRNATKSQNSQNGQAWVDLNSSTPLSLDNWSSLVADDIVSGDRNSSLRNFLWKYGAETEAGRTVFKPLIKTWKAIRGSGDFDLIGTITAVDGIFPPIPSLNMLVFSEILKYSTNHDLPAPAIDFIIRNLQFLDDNKLSEVGPLVGKILWGKAPDRIKGFFVSNVAIERSIASFVARIIEPDEALSVSIGNPDLFCAILEANPKIAASSHIWNAPSPVPRCAGATLLRKSETDTSILDAMMDANNPDVPRIGIEIFGLAAVKMAVDQFDSNGPKKQHIVAQWLHVAKEFPNHILSVVAQNEVKNVETLAYISSLISYRLPPISPETDEWASAISQLRNSQGNCPIAFHAFLLGRALGGFSPEPEKLIIYSFSAFHNALMKSSVPSAIWGILEPVLPEISWWDSWDRAHRTRLGVVNFLIDHKIPPSVFWKIANNEKTFNKFVEIASTSVPGCKYLKDIRTWAKDLLLEEKEPRLEIIHDALKKAHKPIGTTTHKE
ncbi:MAG: hypothetical protein WA705_29150 [Candidatus Ozemobacteraceae bacterium]